MSDPEFFTAIEGLPYALVYLLIQDYIVLKTAEKYYSEFKGNGSQ